MIITFDIGGTSIKYGLLDGSNKLDFISTDEVDSDAKKIKGPGIVDKLIRIIENLSEPIEGIAISTAGMVDADKGSIIYANENIPEYTGMKIKDILEDKFHVPCWVENDVNAAALGEMYFGSGKGIQDALVLTIGTGIGGAVILNQEVFHGHSNSAGEIGYMILGDEYYEKLGSTTTLVKNVQKATNETDLNGKIIFQRAKQDDEVCIHAIDDLCDNIMKGISNCVCILNPQEVILGGGIMAQKEYLEPILHKAMRKYFNPHMLENTRLAFAQLGNSAGMAGAYVNWLKRENKI